MEVRAPVRPAAAATARQKKKAIGIGGDWEFELLALARGCEVHAFDPTLALRDQQHRLHLLLELLHTLQPRLKVVQSERRLVIATRRRARRRRGCSAQRW